MNIDYEVAKELEKIFPFESVCMAVKKDGLILRKNDNECKTYEYVTFPSWNELAKEYIKLYASNH